LAEDIAGRGDPLKTLHLLWRRAAGPRRGPTPKASLDDLVGAAITIADAEGLGAVSTRRVADLVGISPMSFYTHIPSKNELLDLMVDAVLVAIGPTIGDTWRPRLEHLARQYWGLGIAHPWLHQLATHRPVLGPHTMASWEAGLASVDGMGLSAIEMDLAVTLVADYVNGAVRGAARENAVTALTGLTDAQWWQIILPFLDTVDFSPYPVASRVGPAVGEAHGAHAPLAAFEFGLQRVLDGLAVFIATRTSGP
jgi:AcrR family transcriptional regulator